MSSALRALADTNFRSLPDIRVSRFPGATFDSIQTAVPSANNLPSGTRARLGPIATELVDARLSLKNASSPDIVHRAYSIDSTNNLVASMDSIHRTAIGDAVATRNGNFAAVTEADIRLAYTRTIDAVDASFRTQSVNVLDGAFRNAAPGVAFNRATLTELLADPVAIKTKVAAQSDAIAVEGEPSLRARIAAVGGSIATTLGKLPWKTLLVVAALLVLLIPGGGDFLAKLISAAASAAEPLVTATVGAAGSLIDTAAGSILSAGLVVPLVAVGAGIFFGIPLIKKHVLKLT